MTLRRLTGIPLRFALTSAALLLLFGLCLTTGAVELTPAQVLDALVHDTGDVAGRVVREARLPMAVTALCCGMALAVAGVLLQTTFRNPLAGPSILGVSTGASLGVALLMLGATTPLQIWLGAEAGSRVAMLLGAMAGAAGVLLLLLLFSQAVKSPTMLLITGIMTGYLASAIVAWLNFFAPAGAVKDFSVWGMGSFMGVTSGELPLFVSLITVVCLLSLLLVKPLNAMLLGDRYAASMGYNPKLVRTTLLLSSGILTAIATAYCGPVGFIGLAVPHIARLIFATSHHAILLPATLLCGAATGLLCAWLCVLPGQHGVLPLGAVTPLVGVPVIIYVILARNRLNYFH